VRLSVAEFLNHLTEACAGEWILLLIAPVVGSFLGAIIRRMPEGRSVAWTRSRCESCETPLAARDLVPILSWALAKGRCRYCGNAIGWFYPGVELAACGVALVALAVNGGSDAWVDCLLGWWLLTLGWTDLRSWLLPDALTLPLVIAGLAVAVLFDADLLVDHALGAALGYLVLFGVAALYRILRGREGLGQGDAKLLAASGAWLGASALPQVIVLAAVSALGVAGCLRLAGVPLGAQSALPFGPFLAIATWVLWLHGPLA
jgi:leader peptidase (prepilin peptidase)/N-methyltransferase